MKKSDKRKSEILAVAQQLFFQHGYDKTTVNQIILQAGISKGAFYHHFASKEDLVGALTEQFRQQVIEQITPIVHSEQPPLKKLNELFQQTQTAKLKQLDSFRLYLQVLLLDENIKLFSQIMKVNFSASYPLLLSVIRQGMAEKVFKCSNAEYGAESILVLGVHMGQQIGQILVSKRPGPQQFEEVKARVEAFEIAVCSLLGLAGEEFVCFQSDDLLKFRQQLCVVPGGSL